MEHTLRSTNVAEILERVLDKGLVIAGDISISIAEIDLLKIKIRLLVASVDKAKEIGINWWENDPYLSVAAQKSLAAEAERRDRAAAPQKLTGEGQHQFQGFAAARRELAEERPHHYQRRKLNFRPRH